MKAWMLHDTGDIRFEEVETPAPKDGEALIRVEACGICGSDIPRIYRTGAHNMPLIPGHEFSGVVERVGKDASSAWIGKRAGVFPLLFCGECGPCLAGHPELCRNYDFAGSRRDGAFAEYVTVPERNLIELPDEVSFEEAAMLEPMAVAVHAVRLAEQGNAPLRTDAAVVVSGLGTIGLLVLLFLREKGFTRLYAIGNKEAQKKRAVSIGIPAEHFCNVVTEDAPSWILERTGGAEVFFECVGKNESAALGLEAAALGGRLVFVGNPFSDMTFSRDCFWKILRNQLTLRGTWNSTFLNGFSPEENPDDWHYALKRLKEKKIEPGVLITHRFGLEELEKGLHIMRDRTEDYCKVMMTRS